MKQVWQWILPLVLSATVCGAAEKKLWADSILGEQAPELVVEQWLTPEPDREGKYVLIDFWATWCGPCRKAVKHLNEWQETFSDRLVIIGISDESADKVKAFDKPALAYASAIDTQGRTRKKLNVTGIPHVILLDPAGVVRWEGYPFLGGHELTEDVIRGIIEGNTE